MKRAACRLSLILAVFLLLAAHPARAQDRPIRIIWLHHSVGAGLIEGGGVREGLTALGYEFYDHGYNGDGLRDAAGEYTGINYDVPGDNTDPDGLAAIFAQPLHDPPDNTFSHLMQYDVIIWKSCFPTSNIADDAQLEAYQSYYLAIRDTVDRYPDKLFIAVTSPPQVPGSSSPDEAARARAFSQWLQSPEYLGGRSNLAVFDFFTLLAGEDNFLRREYRVDNTDAHPNEAANQAIGPIFVEFVDQAIQAAGLQPGAAPPEPAAEPGGPPASGQPAPVSGLIDGFETLSAPWEVYTDRPESVIECGADPEFAYEGTASLRIHYQIAAAGWGDCGTVFPEPQDWRGSTGLSLWLLAEAEGQPVMVIVNSAVEAGSALPYVVRFPTTAASAAGWTQFSIPWSDFTLAEWADPNGPPQIDLTRITGYAFNFEAPEEGLEGIYWVDSVGLTGEAGTAEPAGEAVEAAPAEEEAAPAAEPEPQTGARRLCPGGLIALPLALLGAGALRRRRAV